MSPSGDQHVGLSYSLLPQIDEVIDIALAGAWLNASRVSPLRQYVPTSLSLFLARTEATAHFKTQRSRQYMREGALKKALTAKILNIAAG